MSLPTPYYSEDGITIYHGDCREILPLFPDKSFDLCLTDPPYGENQSEWDKEKPTENVFPLMFNSLREGGCIYYWGFWGHADYVLGNLRKNGFKIQSRIVWWFATGRPEKKSYREDTEECWYASREEPKTFNAHLFLEPYEDENNYSRYGREGKHPGTVWRASRILHNHPEATEHPTQKPLAIISKMVGISSNIGDTILDPFMGSGTTLVAAKQLGRKAVGIEISEKYCEIAVKRLAQRELF